MNAADAILVPSLLMAIASSLIGAIASNHPGFISSFLSTSIFNFLAVHSSKNFQLHCFFIGSAS